MPWHRQPACISPSLLHTTTLSLTSQGTEWESQEAKKIILGTARNPLDARTFNYASAAHNNHWFFKRLTPTPKPMSSAFAAQLAASFSSVETLKREFVVTAEVMFGPGYIWLVKLTNNRDAPGQMHPYRLLTTYLAGTPYAGGHWRRQEVDRNTVSREHEAAGTLAGANWPRTRGAKGTVESQVPAPGGINVQPLLCLNTWEHVWLRDYGFGVGGHGGKANYVENWWDVVDWEAVEYDAFATSGKQKFKQ